MRVESDSASANISEMTRPTSRCGPSNNLPLFSYVMICKKTLSKKPPTGHGDGQTYSEQDFEATRRQVRVVLPSSQIRSPPIKCTSALFHQEDLRPNRGGAAHPISGQPSEGSSAVGPDLVNDLHAAKGLPKEQRQHAHVQSHMSLARNQIAPLHKG